MHLLHEFVSIVLVEGRIDDVKKLYPNVDVDALAAGQPAGSNNKYLQWSARQVAAGASAAIVLASLQEFHDQRSRMQKKDINQYTSVDELQTALPKREKSKAQAKQAMKGGADQIFDDGRFIVVRPNTQSASCVYGAGTRWCISAVKSKNYFKDYSKRNARFYFIIDRSRSPDDDLSKVAYVKVDIPAELAGGRNVDVYTANDVNIDVSKLPEAYGAENFEALKRAIDEHDVAEPESWDVVLKKKRAIPIEQLQRMWKDLSDRDKINVLMTNPSFRLNDLLRFAKSKNSEFRTAIASRRDLPREVIDVLLNDDDKFVLTMLVRNHALSSDELHRFVNNGNVAVRIAVAQHPNTSVMDLEKLSNDERREVHSAAAKMLETKR